MSHWEPRVQEFLKQEWERNGKIFTEEYCAYRLECTECSTTFYARLPSAKYCSYRCQNDARIERSRIKLEKERSAKGPLTCENCSNTFDDTRVDARYCGSSCRQSAYRTRKALQLTTQQNSAKGLSVTLVTDKHRAHMTQSFKCNELGVTA